MPFPHRNASRDLDIEVTGDGNIAVTPKPSTTKVILEPNSLPAKTLAITQPRSSSWKDLFVFTKAAHAVTLVAALLSSGLAAGFKVGLAVVLGQVFNIISGYASGERSGQNTVSNIARWSLIIFGLGIGNWIANSVFLALWVVFGELQASSVRHDTFLSLLSKDMSWFESQEQGVSSLLARIQT